MIPRNLLSVAGRVTGMSIVLWFRANRTKNEIGLWVDTFSAPLTIKGSFQVVSHIIVTKLGLDMKKEYFAFYTTTVMQDLERNVSGDQLEFAGNRFQIMANEDWWAIAGFNGTMVVKITP